MGKREGRTSGACQRGGASLNIRAELGFDVVGGGQPGNNLVIVLVTPETKP